MKTKGIFYYVLDEHVRKISSQSKYDAQTCYEMLSKISSEYDSGKRFTEIPVSAFQKITRDYRDYFSFLVNSKIIFIDNVYVAGSKCRGYRLREESFSEVVRVEMTDRKYLKDKISFFNSRKKEMAVRTCNPVLTAMRNDFVEYTRNIDYDGALAACSNLSDPNARVNSYSRMARLQNGTLYFKRNKTNNRIDHNLTNVPSVMRYFTNGEYTQIDIRNSQPYFLFVMISSIRSSKDNSKFYRIASRISESELAEFGKSITSGRFYDDCASKLGCSRDEFKSKSMKILFSDPKHYERIKKWFATVYPTLMSAIEDMKKEVGTSEFAITLQKMESAKVIDDICSDLVAAGVKSVTVHDSWIVKTSDLETALTIIRKNFETSSPELEVSDFKKELESKLAKSKYAPQSSRVANQEPKAMRLEATDKETRLHTSARFHLDLLESIELTHLKTA